MLILNLDMNLINPLNLLNIIKKGRIISMKFLVCIFSIWAFIRSSSYAIFEYQTNKNTVGAISVMTFNIITFVFINVMLLRN